MKRYTKEKSLTRLAREASRRAHVLELHHHLIIPSAPGVINRVAACVGDELRGPETSESLLVATWAANAKALRDAERDPGTNTPEYLVVALGLVMAPLNAALDLRVVAADGSLWRPEEAPEWRVWRDAHPDALTVSVADGGDTDARWRRRVELERWALGPRFTEKVEATAGWPNVAATA